MHLVDVLCTSPVPGTQLCQQSIEHFYVLFGRRLLSLDFSLFYGTQYGPYPPKKEKVKKKKKKIERRFFLSFSL